MLGLMLLVLNKASHPCLVGFKVSFDGMQHTDTDR